MSRPYWASSRQNLSSAFSTKGDSIQSHQLQRLISLVANQDMILSKKRIKKVFISLCGCTGWSAPLLFANPEDRFSHVEVHLVYVLLPEGVLLQPQKYQFSIYKKTTKDEL